ncbi:MAG: non-homologous end-joining DNA ligase, partial [Acidimicrobiales bacterium]
RPDLVVSRMTRSLRPGKILIDWSQNNPAKTTVTCYSLRALTAPSSPSASTPVTWDEVESCAEEADPSMLSFGPDEVRERVERLGDLFGMLGY